MTENDALRALLRNLFSSQLLAVLGTQGENGPYGSLVAFAATDDLRLLLFATLRSTRKYRNILEAPRAFLFIDNRSNREADFSRAVAVTAEGSVKETSGTERHELEKLYLAKHPHLRDFVADPACALLKVKVDRYSIVRKFREVLTLPMDE